MSGRLLGSLKLVGTLVLMLLCGCKEKIVHNLNENDANRVLSALARDNLAAEKQSEGTGWSIAVERDLVMRALAVLEESRILGRIVEQAPRSSSFVQTREESQRHVEREVAASLEDTFGRLPGVLEARVHLYIFPENRLEIRPSNDSRSGSVLLVVDPSYAVSEDQVKSLVSGASGVSSKQITVVVTLGTSPSRSTNNIAANDMSKQSDGSDRGDEGGALQRSGLNQLSSRAGLEEVGVMGVTVGMRELAMTGVSFGLACLVIVWIWSAVREKGSRATPQVFLKPSLLKPRSGACVGEGDDESSEGAFVQ